MPTVLLVEDEPVFASTVAAYLEAEGYGVIIELNGTDGLARYKSQDIECVLLDLRLPDMDGFEVCRQMRLISDTPIVILSARTDEADKVLGLELGADDYTTKGTSPRELLARIRAVTRRSTNRVEADQVLRSWGYEVDRRAHTVLGPNGAIELTHLEFELLVLFASKPGAALEREHIFNEVWNQQGLGSSRTIDTHVVTLRTKMPNLKITTVRGVGYRLEAENQS